MNQSRPFRKPPDVEEALSSMLWTPYDNNASDTDSSLDDSHDGCPGDLGSCSSSSQHHIQSNNNNNYLPSSSSTAMKRSFSEWNYRSASSKSAVGHNRYSYPYGYGFHSGTMVAPSTLDPAAAASSGVHGYWNSNNIYSNGSFTGSASAGFFPPFHDWKDCPLVPLVPVHTHTTPLLPFSLLGVDTASAAVTVIPGGVGRMTNSVAGVLNLGATTTGYGASFYEDDLINSNMMLGVSDSSFGDYQVYPSTGSYLSPIAPLQPPSSSHRQFSSSSSPSSSSSWSSSAASGYNPINGGYSGYDNNNSSLCRISAMLKPVMRSDGGTSGHSGNVGDLHFSKHQQRPPSDHSSMMENATGSGGTTTTMDEAAAADGRIQRSRSSADEWMKRNEYREPFNGYQYQHSGGGGGAEFIVEEEGGCEGAAPVVEQAAVDGRATTAIRAASAAASDRFGFSSERIVNGEAYTSDLVGTASSLSPESRYRCRSAFVDSVRDYSRSDSGNSSRVRALQQNLRGFGRSVRDRFVRDIMRLNVPAAPEGGSRTSVYIPSAEGTATTVESAVSLLSESGAGQPRPTLTIQVNRVDTNNQEQNDVVNNASSGVSIVNCYRETPPKGDQENVVPNGQDRPQECQFYTSDVNSATTIVDKNLVNISANAEQMVHVSNTVVQSGSSDPVDLTQKNQSQTMPQTDIDRIEPAAATPNRTYTSTEAQTDLLDPSPYPTPNPIPYPTHHPPPPLLLSPPGSEFSTREHRRRERRERRQARNRLAHIHPIEPHHGAPPPIRHQPPPPPPPIELIPDILHSHLPPPYTTLPMGASAAAVLHHPGPLLAPPIGPHHPAVAVAAVHHRGAAVGAAEDCRYSFPIPIMRR